MLGNSDLHEQKEGYSETQADIDNLAFYSNVTHLDSPRVRRGYR